MAPTTQRESPVLVILAVVVLAALGGAAAWRTMASRERPTYTAHPMEGLGRIVGRAVDGEGRPAKDLRLSWMAEQPGGAYMGSLTSEPTGADGSFRIEGIPPGAGFVAVTDPLHEGASGTFDVFADMEAGDIEVDVERIPDARITSGTVRAEDGTPLAGVRVRGRKEGLLGSSMTVVTTDQDGVFRLAMPGGGDDLKLEFEADGFIPLVLEGYGMGRSDLEVVLTAPDPQAKDD